jgi:hypothetical protein
MGPGSSSNMSSSSSVKITNLPRLAEDGSNWVTFKERIINNLTLKGLMRHVRGTAHQPVQLTEHNGSYYHPNELSPLSDEDLEKHEDSVDKKKPKSEKLFTRQSANLYSSKSRMKLQLLVHGLSW